MAEAAVIPAEEVAPKPKRVKKEVRELIVEREGRTVNACNLCEKLCGSRRNIVNGRGPRHARMAIIGASPNELSDVRDRAWAGPDGETISMWLQQVGVDPAEVYFDNAVKCHPDETHKVSDREIKNCSDHLWAALQIINPDIIVAAGNEACKALLPPDVAAEGITKLRGHIFWNEKLRRKIIPMFHPSAVFHEFSQEIFCIADLRKAAKESENPTVVSNSLGDYTFLTKIEDVERECERLSKADILVYDTETTHSATLTCEEAGDKGGLDWESAQVLCIGLTDEVEKGYIVPIVGKNFRQIWTPEEYKRMMRAVRNLFKSDVPKVAQNGKFDVHMLRQLGVEVRDIQFDTMLCYSFINESASHALEPMRSMYTTMPFYDTDVYNQTAGKKHMERAEEETIWTYCCADVDCTLRVAKELNRLIDIEGADVRWIFENVSMPASIVASHIEETGVLIDMELAKDVIDDCDHLIATTEKDLFNALDAKYHTLNYKSPQQLKKLLYVDLGLPLPPVLTETGGKCADCRERSTQHWYHTSTNKDAIHALDGSHPVITPLQQITMLMTLRKTFLLGEEGKNSGLLQHVKKDGRIHTSYRCDAVETGRWSSSPNLQNIPKDSDERPAIYKLIRKLFVAPAGKLLVEIDYSQIELRILSYLSGQTEMIEKFEHNEDFHTYTARNILWPELDAYMTDAEWKEAHDDRRTGAKRVNFGIPYGLTAFGMSQWLHCTEEEAMEHIKDYMDFFTNVKEYFRKSDRDVARGRRKNAFGRIRHFHGVKSMRHFGGYRRVLGHMKREAYNYPIQSTAADVLSLALIAIDNDQWFWDNECYIVLTVHDSITLECPEEIAIEAGQRAQQHFLEAGQELTYTDSEGNDKPFYLPGEGKIGPRWSEWIGTIELDGTYKPKKVAA